jgi:hypothetical protein
MYKITVINLINGREFGREFETEQLLNEHIAKQEAKAQSGIGWGYSARSILKSECPESHLPLVLSEEDRLVQEAYEKPIFKLDANDQPVMEEYTYYDLDNNLQTGQRPVVDHYETVPAVYETWVNLDKEYTITIQDITAQYEADQELAKLIADGQNDENCCKDIVRLIGGYNKQRNLPLASVQQMLVSFAPINECLKNNMPGTAKALMAGITPDETIITQELVDKCNIIFAKYGIE